MNVVSGLQVMNLVNFSITQNPYHLFLLRPRLGIDSDSVKVARLTIIYCFKVICFIINRLLILI